ncbi:MAG: ATP-binding protein [Tannerellaceae bacterium]
MDTQKQEIKTLKQTVKLLEQLSTIGLVSIGVVLVFNKASIIPFLIALLLVVQIYKSIVRKKLKQKEYLEKEVEERTKEIRSERDAVQEESAKLTQALNELAETQDELVRQEKMATVGQLTQGLVDRILNPLNYINNFTSLSANLANDLRSNLESQREKIDTEVYTDSQELLHMLDSNLEKITEHGANTVRVVKAMEELLKDRRGNTMLTDVNELCRINIDKLRKAYSKEIEEKQIAIDFHGLTLSLLLELNVEQMSNIMLCMLKNAIYALLKKAEKETFSPRIELSLKIENEQLLITLRDNGIGIEENIREKIFAPFFTTKPSGEAAGVGLYLSREVIQNHRGTIKVESEKNEYTEFRIALPVYQPVRETEQSNEEGEE